MSRKSVRNGLAIWLGLAAFAISTAEAQQMQPLPPAAKTDGWVTQAQQRPAAAPKGAAEAAKPQGGDAALRQRVEQLEEQLVDLQVVIGTLESLARSGAQHTAAAAPTSASLAAADSGRLEAVETQVRALASQIEQLSSEVRGGGYVNRRSEPPAPPPAAAPGYSSSPGVVFGTPPAVTSDTLDPIGGLIDNSGAAPATQSTAGALQPNAYQPASPQVAAAPPAPAAGGSSRVLYEAAYGQLLRQDYGAAQAGFTEFLRQYPSDTLAPDALFWLGETHYVQRNYADAAEAFDLVTTTFASSSKAPDAQLKRAMSLVQVGKKDEACNAFRQLDTRFPNARENVKSRALTESQRAGCG